MAIAKVKYIELIAHNEDKKNILTSIEKAEILQLKTKEETLNPEKIKHSLEKRAALIRSKLNKATFLLRILDRFYSPKTELIDYFIPLKPTFKKEEFENIVQNFPLEKLYKEVETLDVDLHHAEAVLKEAIDNRNQLENWKNLDFNPNESETANTYIILGTIKPPKEKNLLELIEDKYPLAHYQIIKKTASLLYIALFVHKKEKDIYKDLKKIDYSLVKLSAVHQNVLEEISTLEAKINKYKTIQKKSIEKIKELGRYRRELTVIVAFFENKKQRSDVEKKLLHTNNVFILEGWIKKKDIDKFKDLITKTSQSYSFSTREPKDDDNPPVILENPSWLKPLEAVTALYGMPTYTEIDPTPLMSPFFLIFFGLAIGDVAYGLALMLISFLLKKSPRFSENSKVFLTLFIYGGATAAFFGVITGSWLTIEQTLLPSFLKQLIVFSPIDKPALFLVITMLLGFAQLYFGMIINMVEVAKKKSIILALEKQLFPLILLPGISLLIAQFLGFGLNKTLSSVAVYLTIIGAVGIVLFSETDSKSILGRLGGGLYNLYAINAFLGDTISYGRIMALGLATFLIGSAINTIILSSAIFKSVLLRIILSISLLPIAHLINLAINTISAFVHPARLQYVEFFSKFFEGGGSRFKPLAQWTDNIKIE